MLIDEKCPIAPDVTIVDDAGGVAVGVKTFNTQTKEAEVFVTVSVSGGQNIYGMNEDGTPATAKCILPGFRAVYRPTGEELTSDAQVKAIEERD